ncbi:MAG: hypothetical protein Q7P63_07705 [Verrucomicrobiota bacterium JB022]|nr:hypothetical protein [Verrucomicrobiota bacterium JB022]
MGVGCVLGLTGLPLACIQVWGWGTMFARYAEFMPTEEALEFTFSGQELCGYCSMVQDAQDEGLTDVAFQLLHDLRLLLPELNATELIARAPVSTLSIIESTLPEEPEKQSLHPPPRGGLLV